MKTYEYDFAFQEKIVAVVFRDPAFLPTFWDAIQVQYFDSHYHKILIQTILNYYTTYGLLPTREAFHQTVSDYYKAYPSPPEVVNATTQMIERLVTADISDAPLIQDKVLDFARRQSLKEGLEKSIEILEDPVGDPLRVLQVIEQASIVGMNGRNAGIDVLTDTDDLLASLSNEDMNMFIRKVSTGIPTMDRAYKGGVGNGELAVVVGPTGKGKSTFLINIGSAALLHTRKTVLHFTVGDLQANDVSTRYLCRMTGFNEEELVLAGNREEVKKRLSFYKQGKAKLLVQYYSPGMVTMDSLNSYASKIQSSDGNLGLIIIDYADNLLAKKGVEDNDWQALGRIYQQMKSMADRFGVPVWTGSQTTRSAYQQDVYDLDSISESYKKMQHCDMAILIQMTREEKANFKIRYFLGKTRRGVDGLMIQGTQDFSRYLMQEDTLEV